MAMLPAMRLAGAAKVTPPAAAWQDRPPVIKQRLARGSGAPKIHVEHPGGGLVMSIHLSDVGPHAISLSHSGGVNVANVAARGAMMLT